MLILELLKFVGAIAPLRRTHKEMIGVIASGINRDSDQERFHIGIFAIRARV